MKLWAAYCKQNGKRAIIFPRDVPTRWNSTYKLLARCYEYRDLLVTFIQYHVSHINLYQSHWDACSNVCGLLKVFYTATNNLSGVYYPTTNLFIIESLNIASAFAHCESDSELHESVTAMKDKWLEYYKEFPNIYLIALCFDPRCRLESLPDYLSAYYEQEDTEDKKFDILYWWKEHERYFPILAMIAKQILSTPVSTVAVEQQFSAGGNILDPKRSLMSPKSLQIQACVEDWTKAQYRQQEIDQEEPYDFFKDDQPAESRTDNHGND
ncbi:hypothetical protein Dsin_001732 [Dipteronia sinensis]|uniref:HAT C-terminal dimerisation domain-containing protein n=1 Tax=Dipteronia sinensis TaxID=43782 RepID=A0AAE0EIQ9_9ROSI|nr:hypothetical protein Dsin_001732 [Dipteronia sinensis]